MRRQLFQTNCSFSTKYNLSIVKAELTLSWPAFKPHQFISFLLRCISGSKSLMVSTKTALSEFLSINRACFGEWSMDNWVQFKLFINTSKVDQKGNNLQTEVYLMLSYIRIKIIWRHCKHDLKCKILFSVKNM